MSGSVENSMITYGVSPAPAASTKVGRPQESPAQTAVRRTRNGPGTAPGRQPTTIGITHPHQIRHPSISVTRTRRTTVDLNLTVQPLYACSLVDEPFERVPEGGPDLTAAEARAHPDLPFIWWVVDRVVERVRRVRWMKHWLLGTTSVQTGEVFDRQEPILCVSHDADDGVWQLIGASNADPPSGQAQPPSPRRRTRSHPARRT